jgi:hypothetical protein
MSTVVKLETKTWHLFSDKTFQQTRNRIGHSEHKFTCEKCTANMLKIKDWILSLGNEEQGEVTTLTTPTPPSTRSLIQWNNARRRNTNINVEKKKSKLYSQMTWLSL